MQIGYGFAMNSGDVALAKFTDKSADGFAMNYTVAPVYARQVVNEEEEMNFPPL